MLVGGRQHQMLLIIRVVLVLAFSLWPVGLQAQFVPLMNAYIKAQEAEQAGRFDDAITHFKRAVDLAEQYHGPENIAVAEMLGRLAGVYKAQGRTGEAEPLYERALAILEKIPGQEDLDAARLRDELVEVRQAMGSDAWPEAVMEAHRQGRALENEGRYRDATPYYQEALERGEREFGPDHLKTAILMNDLGTTYFEQGRYAEAEPLYRRARRRIP